MTASPPPALIQRKGRDPFAWHDGRPITVDEFLHDVRRTAAALPDVRWLVNACEDRYRFLVAFFAIVITGRANLLPAVRTPDAFQSLTETYPGAAAVTDDAVSVGGRSGHDGTAPMPAVAEDAVAAIAFTSGSTGAPQPHAKPWSALAAGAGLHAQRLTLTVADPWQAAVTLVATVPPWHMYGLEWTVLLATRAPVTVYCGESFFPDDVRRALSVGEGRRVLVTTPIHLRALMRAAIDYPTVDVVVCATAPLERALAEEAEARLGARLLEIYGCSEAGTLAHRLPTGGERWWPFPGFALAVDDGVATVAADFLPAPVPLADRLELAADGSFRLLGRLGDLVKVAGKRASLGGSDGTVAQHSRRRGRHHHRPGDAAVPAATACVHSSSRPV